MSYNSLSADADLIVHDLLNGSSVGTLQNSSSYTTGGLYGGQRLLLDAANEGVSYGSKTFDSGSYTFMANIEFDSPSSQQHIFYMGAGGSLASRLNNSGYWLISDAGSMLAVAGAAPTASVANWWSVVRTGTTNARLFLNGTQQIEDTTLTTFSALTDTLVLGNNSAFNSALRAKVSDFWAFDRALTSDERAEIRGGPEPINTVAPTFNATTGAWTVGTWDSQGNGTLLYTVTLRDDADDSLVATLQTSSATTSGNCLSDLVTAGAGTYYILVAASNDGGNDPTADYASTSEIYTPASVPTYSGAGVTLSETTGQVDLDEANWDTNGGGDLTFNVLVYLNGVLQDTITSYDGEDVRTHGYGTYHVEVVGVNDGGESEPEESNEIVFANAARRLRIRQLLGV